MKILIYAHNFAPLIGGAETYVMLLAQGLALRPEDLCITVATPTPAAEFDDTTLPFRVIRQPSMARLWQLISAADIVQLAGPVLLPLLLGLLQRRPVAIEHHGYQACCPNGLLLYEPTKTACPGHFMAQRYHQCLRCNSITLGWFRSLLKLLLTFPRRLLCHLATVHITVSHNVQRRIQFPRSQPIYHGIPDPCASGVSASHDQIIPQPVCFAYVGRLVSEKGLPLLLEAARRVDERGYDFRIKFIGDGPQRPRLEYLTTDLRLQRVVSFTGFVQGPQLQHALADVAAVVMPSIWEETAGLAAIEQMMRGRLVIAANIGGLGEIVGEAGLRFPMGDVDALADCLQRVLDDPPLVQQLGRIARIRAVQQFHQDRMVEEHLQLYAALM